MTFADDEEFAAFIGRDHMLPSITAESVSSALANFSLSLAPDRDMEWLATAVRRALGISLRSIYDGPDRPSNTEVRETLHRLAKVTEDAWEALFNCNYSADSRLWTVAWRRWDGEGGNIGEPAEYRRFRAAVQELDWLSGFLRLAASETPIPSGPWRDSERKLIRIQRAQYLAPIFEAAFGKRATANNYGSDARHKKPTSFMAFYVAMVKLAFGARETANLSEVAKVACRKHRQCPAQFGEGVIPGL